MASEKTVKECLECIDVTLEHFSECQSLQEEFATIKKLYFKKILKAHPDKGGDPAVFREVQTCFEVLRELFDANRITSFATDCDNSTAEEFGEMWKNFDGMPTPSWDFFYAAAETPVPMYRVELAKSGRSKCRAKGSAKKCDADSVIAKAEIRVGSLNEDTGTYWNWKHLQCWRVPNRVWLGVPDPEKCHNKSFFETALIGMNEVLLCGFSDLSNDEKSMFIKHVMDKSNWAAKRKPSKTSVAKNASNRKRYHKSTGDGGSSSSAGSRNSNSSSEAVAEQQTSGVLVKQGYHAPRQYFVAPVPGKNGAVANSLQGKTFVLTGTFPELGGGAGLSLGKAKLKHLITSFGGAVRSAVSGKTDVLVVGKNPGFSKVSKAREKRKTKLLSVKDLKGILEGGSLEDAGAKPMVIANFSNGFNNSSARTASAEQLAIARGTMPPSLEDERASLKKRPGASPRKPIPGKKRKKSNVVAVKKENHPPSLEGEGVSSPKVNSKGEACAFVAVKKEAKAKKQVSDDDGETMIIVCDGCGIDCTEKSWYHERTKSDYCTNCRGRKKTVLQRNGVTVAESKANGSRKRKDVSTRLV